MMLRVDVFGQYFPDADARRNATVSVGSVVERFGGTVVSGTL